MRVVLNQRCARLWFHDESSQGGMCFVVYWRDPGPSLIPPGPQSDKSSHELPTARGISMICMFFLRNMPPLADHIMETIVPIRYEPEAEIGTQAAISRTSSSKSCCRLLYRPFEVLGLIHSIPEPRISRCNKTPTGRPSSLKFQPSIQFKSLE